MQRAAERALRFGNTVVLWASNMLTGGHTPKLPWMLAGSCGGYFKPGQFLRFAADFPVNLVAFAFAP